MNRRVRKQARKAIFYRAQSAALAKEMLSKPKEELVRILKAAEHALRILETGSDRVSGVSHRYKNEK